MTRPGLAAERENPHAKVGDKDSASSRITVSDMDGTHGPLFPANEPLLTSDGRAWAGITVEEHHLPPVEFPERTADSHLVALHFHPNALLAAEAAEAAGAQGRFWEMHDLLCERSLALDDARLKGYARELELNLERFEREMREHAYLEKVREDMASGVAGGVKGTPSFFINGVRYGGEVDLDSLLAAIEEAGNRAISQR
jgi:predicted DsbA family dithiol-disulfide isomerase